MTSELYGKVQETPHRASTPLYPRSPYAAAKLYPYWITVNCREAYRRQYGCPFISAMPTNLYGPGDNYALQTCHVPAAMQVKVHHAKRTGARAVDIWVTGTPKRLFLNVDDLADGLMFMMKHHSAEGFLNLGAGQDVSIPELAELVAKVADSNDEFVYDRSKPDGTLRKEMDVSGLAAMGWRVRTPLQEGFRRAFQWYVDTTTNSR